MRGIGLQNRIIAIVALGLASVLFIFGFLAVAAVQQSKDLVFQERLALAESVAGHFNYLLSRTLRQMEDLTALNPVDLSNQNLDDEKQLLYRTDLDLGIFSSVQMVDSNGKIIWTEPPSVGSDISVLPQVRRIFQTGIPSIDAVDPSGGGAGHDVALTVPIWSHGVTVAAMIGKLSLARIGLDILPAPNLGRTGRSELIDRGGTVIASSGEDPPGYVVDHTIVLGPLLDNHASGVVVHSMPKGAVRPDHIVAYAPLAALPWGVIVEQDQDVALALPQELQSRMLLIGALAVLVAGAFAWTGVGRLVSPLKALTLASQRMAGGDLESSVAIKRGDEIGMLARSFEAMRVKLKGSLEEIRRWNLELEDRVAKRTAEVARRNQELLMLNSLAETVNRSLDLEEVIAAALSKVLNLTEADAGSIKLKGEMWGTLSSRIDRSPAPAHWQESCPSLETCLCGQAALRGEPLVVRSAAEGGRDAQPACLQNGFESLAILPLRSNEKVLGLIYLASSKPEHFSSWDLGLLEAVSHQIGIAIEKARLYGELQLREELRRQLLAKVISAQEEERKRIARELHDESAQALTALIMSIQAAQDALPREMDKERERLAKAKAQSIHALTEMRQMILDLRPTALDDLGLVPAIRWYTETHLQPLGIQFSVEMAGIKRRLPPEIETSLFRISQEAINNVAKHSHAKRADILFQIREKDVECVVRDDGIGFDVDARLSHKGPDMGLGLLGLQERVNLLGGSLSIESGPGKGSRLGITIPLGGG